MNLTASLCELLACPLTGKPLQLVGGQLQVDGAAQRYPVINDIPWVLPNPDHSLLDWGAKLNHFNQVLLSEISALEAECQKAQGPTLDRLERLLAAKKRFLRCVGELLLPVVNARVAQKPVYDALRDRAPSTQNLLSYEANLYRDWVWGERENALTKDLVLAHLQPQSLGNLLVLGAGAGRLALDLHCELEPDTTVATDINPLLMMCFKHLLDGKELRIDEFPLNPRASEFVAVEHLIKGLQWPQKFHLLFSDATNPAFQPEAFNTVLTPWLIDIQPLAFGRFLRQLNQYLPEGGQWINFGSLVFNQKRDLHCYSIEEVKQLAEAHGFNILELKTHEIPYLKSPYNAGYRMEHVWTWRAQKVAAVKPLHNPQAMPNWILDIQQAVPKTQYFRNFSITHRVYAQLAGEVDGRTSIAKIAKKMAKQNNMDVKESEVLVKNFFSDIFLQSG